MSRYPLKDYENEDFPNTPEEESRNFGDSSGLDVFETPAGESFNEQSLQVIEESVQEESDVGSDEEDSHNSALSDDEITEDEVDRSRASENRKSLNRNSTERGKKQKAQRFIEYSEDDSSDNNDISYHVSGPRLGSDEKCSTSHIGDLEESYQVYLPRTRKGKLVIKSSEENSAENSEVEDLAIPDSNDGSAESPLSLKESFLLSSRKKKVPRNQIDSDSSDSVEVTPSNRRKAASAISDSDSSAEATPFVRRTASSSSEESDDGAKATPYVRRKGCSSSEESDYSAEATPHTHSERKGSKAVRYIESAEDDTEEEIIPEKTTHQRNTFESDASTEEDYTEEVITKKASISPPRQRFILDTSDSEDNEEEEAVAKRLPSSSRIPTPRMIEDALLATSLDRHDSGNDSNMDPLNGTHERSRKSADKRFSPPATVGEDEEIPIQDLSNSILEVSSTVVSFSSPGSVQEQENSITEIMSPESARAPAPPSVVRLSDAEMAQVREELNRQKLILKSSNLKSLPDGGARIREKIHTLTEKLDAASKLPPMPVVFPVRLAPSQSSEAQEDELRKKLQMKKWAMGTANAMEKERLRTEIGDMERRLIQLSIANATNAGNSKYLDYQNEMLSRQPAAKEKGVKLLSELPKLTDEQKKMFADNAGKELYKKTESGYISAAARREAVSITMDSLENLHRSLASCPKETDKESTPACLTVPLLPHQERALAWLLWRETQIPAGGILADDMGLGKTLTMISLVVSQKERDPPPPASSDIWLSKTVKIKRSSGTLVVCPASVVGQWEKEIQRRCKRNTLSIVIFHGPDRAKYAAKLHQYDIVITTYQIVSREISNTSLDKKDADSKPIGDFDVEVDAKAMRQSVLLQIAFDRIILDEAHVIRNPKAGISQAVCRLRASRRWAVTGTPVQNKELDMYSLLRFLRVTPFDQLVVWKRWVDSSKAKTEQAQGRLQLLIKTLLLRRTKDQKVEGSEIPLVAMPSREVHTHQVELSIEENEVYQKLLAFSRKALEDYIKHQENKLKEGFTYDRSNLPEIPQKNVTKQMMLVLLLRLRQVCSHPALIKTMLDTADAENMGSGEAPIEENDLDLIAQMSTMTLGDNPDGPKKEEENFFTHTNPIFDRENMSSKMRYIIDEVRKVVEKRQKAVVVSQWTSMLELFAQHFRRLRIRCHLIAGSVAIKHRTEIVEDFNGNPDGAPVILLSLGAGGVGLNLIGGNHIFLADMHWNPQLEAQACDRVYRVGQTKDVHVHRMITQGTVEERILKLQQEKLAMANGILTGAAKLTTKGLTIEDLKMLFNPGPPAYAPKPMVNPIDI